MRTVVSVVGNRPQFIKAAPLARALDPVTRHVLVHTGQHYDHELSQVFFDELGLRPPDHRIDSGSGSHAGQVAAMMAGLEPVLEAEAADLVLVYGDTNSTLAGALVAAKRGQPLGHVESGLRSFDRAMPEEVNRVVADVVSDLRFCPSQTAVDNLAAEGMREGVHLVGDVMVDTALHFGPLARERSGILDRLGVTAGGFALVTVHRQSNTGVNAMPALVEVLDAIGMPVVFPLHPRTRAALDAAGLTDRAATAAHIEPPLRLPRLHRPRVIGGRCPDRLRRRPEGGLPALSAVPHAARHQRVGGDRAAGLEPAHGRPGRAAGGGRHAPAAAAGRASAAVRRRARGRADRGGDRRFGVVAIGTMAAA